MQYETFSDVVEEISYFIGDVYNQKRLYFSLAIGFLRNTRDYVWIKNDTHKYGIV